MKIIKLTTLALVFLPLFCFSQYTWEEVTTPDTVELDTFTFDTAGNLYIGTTRGVYFSEDDNQWQFIGPHDFANYIYINNNNTIYTGMDELYRSFDNGKTWDSSCFKRPRLNFKKRKTSSLTKMLKA